MKKIVFDLDGTLCVESPTFEKSFAEPRKDVIKLINDSFKQGMFIIIYTARSWAEYPMTERWLNEHNIRYHLLMCGKPIYDIWIDDRSLNPDYNFEKIKEKIYG